MSAPDVAKLKRLAFMIVEINGCVADWDGDEYKPGDEGFVNHAYYQDNHDGTEGCLRCMALDALGGGK